MTPLLLIYLDAPTLVDDRRHRPFVSEAASLLRWFCARMSLDMSKVYMDYILKCYPVGSKDYGKKPHRLSYIEACSVYRIATLQQLKPKAVIGMGSKCCEAFMGSDKVGNFEGTSWTPLEPLMRNFVEKVFISYGPAYALENPAETVSIYRTLWAAAEAAGLQPEFNKNLKQFDYGK
jgi:uracil-DNA glycosylase family 4